MRLRDVDEFGLIDRLAALGPELSDRVLVGIGDDAAVLRSPSADASDLLLTTDTFVEGVHFFPLGHKGGDTGGPPVTTGQRPVPLEIGYKAIVANVSDIAAMGGLPTAAVVSLACRGDLSTDVAEGLYRGMAEAAQEYGLDLVGGDTVSTDGPAVITVALLGEVPAGQALLRSGARPGDVIAVTGTLGEARGAFALVERGAWSVEREELEHGRPGTAYAALLSRLTRPQARLQEGQLLRETGLVTAAMDISDGLAGDLRRLAAASGAGVEIFEDRIPLSPELVETFGTQEARRLALEGGEDFELLFTCREERFEDLRNALERRSDAGFAAIGRVLDDPSALLLRTESGEVKPLPEGSWVHFRSEPA